MSIKKLNEKLEELLEDDIEWVYEKICDVEPISKNENVLNELLLGHIDMYGQLNINEAVDTIAEFYHEGKLRVAIPTKTKFKYKDNEYQLFLALGNCVFEQHQLKCKYGIKHILDRHSKENATKIDTQSLTTEKALLQAIKDIENAIDKGKAFMGKYEKDKLAILYKGFLYIICYATKEQEVTYLHTLFKPNKKYLNTTLKRQYEPTNNLTITRENQ